MSNELTFKEEQKWKERLQSQQKKTVESLLDYAELVYEFAEYCTPGTFTNRMWEWCGISKAMASKWKQIGYTAPKLRNKLLEKSVSPEKINLPMSQDGLYQLTQLNDKELDKALKLLPNKPTKQETTAVVKEIKQQRQKPKREPRVKVISKEEYLKQDKEYNPEAIDKETEEKIKEANEEMGSFLEQIMLGEQLQKMELTVPKTEKEAFIQIGILLFQLKERNYKNVVKRLLKSMRQALHPDKGIETEITIYLNKILEVLNNER